MLKRSPKIVVRARDHEGGSTLASNYKAPKNSLRDAHLILTWIYENLPPETVGTLLSLLMSEFQPMHAPIQPHQSDFTGEGYED